MKRPAALFFCALSIVVICATPMAGKPPRPPTKDADKKPTATASPTPVLDASADAALARRFVQAPSGADAIALPFVQVLNAATGKRALPFEPGNATDAATLTKLGAALDALLPRMNLPESPAKTVSPFGGPGAVAKCFEAELRTALQSVPASGSNMADSVYPAMKIVDTSGKTYYLAVTLYPTSGGATTPSLNIQPEVTASRITEDGCCLLIGIEYNGKQGRDITFLNWRVLDLARLKMRFVPAFQAGGQEVLQPGAVLTDGRKGRD